MTWSIIALIFGIQLCIGIFKYATKTIGKNLLGTGDIAVKSDIFEGTLLISGPDFCTGCLQTKSIKEKFVIAEQRYNEINLINKAMLDENIVLASELERKSKLLEEYKAQYVDANHHIEDLYNFVEYNMATCLLWVGLLLTLTFWLLFFKTWKTVRTLTWRPSFFGACLVCEWPWGVGEELDEINLQIEYLFNYYKEIYEANSILMTDNELLDEQIAQIVLSLHKCRLSSILDLICEDPLVLVEVCSIIAVLNIFLIIVFTTIWLLKRFSEYGFVRKIVILLLLLAYFLS